MPSSNRFKASVPTWYSPARSVSSLSILLLVALALPHRSEASTHTKSEKAKKAHSQNPSMAIGNTGSPPASYPTDPKISGGHDTEDRVYRVKVEDEKWHLWAPLIVNILIAVGGFVAAVAVWRQANSNGESAKAATQNADALIGSQRAWLTVTPEKFNPESPTYGDAKKKDLSTTSMVIKNVGPTPALVYSTSVQYVMLDSPDHLPSIPKYAPAASRSGHLLIPQDTLNELVSLEHDQEIIPAEINQKLLTKAIVLYIYGYATYTDVFGMCHETRFGYVYEYYWRGVGQARRIVQGGPPEYNKAT